MAVDKETILNIVKEIFKYGFSAIMATAGITLIYLGCTGKAIMPQSFWSGIIILVFSILFYVGETLKYYLKLKYKNKKKERNSYE